MPKKNPTGFVIGDEVYLRAKRAAARRYGLVIDILTSTSYRVEWNEKGFPESNHPRTELVRVPKTGSQHIIGSGTRLVVDKPNPSRERATQDWGVWVVRADGTQSWLTVCGERSTYQTYQDAHNDAKFYHLMNFSRSRYEARRLIAKPQPVSEQTV